VPASRSRPAFRLLWSDEALAYDLGAYHPFQQRYRRLGVALYAALTERDGDRPEAGRRMPLAAREELLRFHRPSYLDRVARVARSEHPGFLDRGDTPGFPGCDAAAAGVVGGTLAALAELRVGGASRSFHPAGGLHHAARDGASGFCIYNDVAVAIARALDGPSPVDRVAYVDVDAHHGDGVMYGFYDDGRLLDLDFHQDGRTLFPGTGAVDETGKGDGAGTKVNVPMPPGAGDAEFVPLFRRIVPPLLETHRPGLVVLQHGLDGHRGDPLTALELTSVAYRAALESVLAWTDEHRVPLLVTGGGGYAPEHVARGLALAALLLDGAPEWPTTVPRGWASEFEAATEQPAPAGFEPSGAPAAFPPLPAWAEAVLEGLSERLGRKL
jgi:acetoin utilization protein AcuC